MSEYYNRFRPENKWVSVQTVGGRRLQAAELNEMQSISQYRDKQLGDVIFGSGHLIEGGQLYINQSKTKVKISPSRVYLDGMIHLIPETTLTITGNGEENICLKINYVVKTYEDDPTLLDPAVGFDNFGMPGANRLVAEPQWVVNDPDGTMLFRLENGLLATAELPPELEGFSPILARRTHDTSGNFLVSGMDGYIEPKDSHNVTLVIDAGKAYVQGYEIMKLVPVRINVDKALDVQSVKNELHNFLTGTDAYPLYNTPVKEILGASAIVEVTKSVTRGNVAGSSDTLVFMNVIDVSRVYTDGKEYEKNKDYKVIGNLIDWSLEGGSEPPGGTTYYVTFTYNKRLAFESDFKLTDNKLVFQTGGDKPVHNTPIQVDYTFYLPRKDVYYLTADGDFKVLKGQSAMHPVAPVAPPDVLELGEIMLPPNSKNAVVTNRKPKRLTMLELRSLLDRLERAEYNQAIFDLDRAAQYSDPGVQKKGIFTDNFTNFERADTNHNAFHSMIDPREKVLQLPMQQDLVDLEIDLEKSTAHFSERLMTIAYDEEILIDQPHMTETMNINPYQVFGNLATVRLVPTHDIWLEQSYITNFIWGWWGDWWNNSRTETRILFDQTIPFIRKRRVLVQGEGFEPFSDYIKATFDGLPVPLEVAGIGSKGTLAGTMKADAQGKFSCTFMIPDGVRAGTREVRFWNEV